MIPTHATSDFVTKTTFRVYRTPWADGNKHCTFTWTPTIFGNAPANSYRSGCHDSNAGPQIASTADFGEFASFDTIKVIYDAKDYVTISGATNDYFDVPKLI
jgi:hypothetical protein